MCKCDEAEMLFLTNEEHLTGSGDLFSYVSRGLAARSVVHVGEYRRGHIISFHRGRSRSMKRSRICPFVLKILAVQAKNCRPRGEMLRLESAGVRTVDNQIIFGT